MGQIEYFFLYVGCEASIELCVLGVKETTKLHRSATSDVAYFVELIVFFFIFSETLFLQYLFEAHYTWWLSYNGVV